MTDYIWVVELAIKPGELQAFNHLMDDMVASIEADEPGTLNYELFISDDQQTAHIYEHYVDGPAFDSHLANFEANFADRFGSVVEVTRFTAYGDPDVVTREKLAGFGADIMRPMVGVARPG